MIKVITKHVWETTCRNCNSTLQYEYSDIKRKTVSDYTGDKETVKYIKCPVCLHDVSVKN